MMEKLVKDFIAALNKLEADNDSETIVALFADDSEIGNVTLTESLKGVNGANDFWLNYRKTFKDINSEFRNRIYKDDTAALEWTTSGTSTEGHPINYEGVSILEFNGDKISRFYAYFNPTKLGHQIMEDK